MAITQAELIEELKRRGYGAITRRWMVSAREKGLLPKLTHQGRGQGIGSRYLILDPETVIDQTITVYELLRLHYRTETALLSTWFAGFEVSIERVREIWLRRIDKLEAQLDLKTDDSDILEDALSKLASTASRKMAQQYGLSRDEAVDVTFEILSSVFEPEYGFSGVSKMNVFVEVIKDFLRNNKEKGISDDLTDGEIQGGMYFFHNIAAVRNIRKLISEATDGELRLAHKQWQMIITIIQRISVPLAPKEWSEPGLSPARQMAITFGGLSVMGLLYFTKFDSNSSVLQTIHLCDKLTHDPEINIIFNGLRKNRRLSDSAEHRSAEFREALDIIWGEFDFHSFSQEIERYVEEIDLHH